MSGFEDSAETVEKDEKDMHLLGRTTSRLGESFKGLGRATSGLGESVKGFEIAERESDSFQVELLKIRRVLFPMLSCDNLLLFFLRLLDFFLDTLCNFLDYILCSLPYVQYY